MSGKLAPLLLAGSGTAVVSVGGYYLVNGAFSKETLSAELTFNDLSKFEQGKGGDCVNYVFGELDFGSKKGSIDASSQITDVDFSSKTSEEVKSCLVVNWEKTNYSNTNASGKWKGYFRWVWSFSAGDKGLIMFLTTKENSLELDGSFYYITQNQEKKWSIEKHKSVSSGKSITQSDFSSTFPTAGTAISSLWEGENKSNWGFVSSDSDISNFCTDAGGSTCGTLNTSSKKTFKESFLWKKKDSGSPITDWIGNYSTWLPTMFVGGDLHLGNFQGSWNNATPTSSN